MAGVMRLDLPLARLRWEGLRFYRRALDQLGWGALAGILLCAIAAALSLAAVRQHGRYLELHQTLEQDGLARPSATPGPQGTEARLAAFEAYLPAHELIPETVRSLIDLADSLGVVLRTGEYKAQYQDPAAFLKYRITLPVKGDAAAIQEFLLAALTEHRTLALESVAFKREGIEASEVEARIQFVLLARAGPVAAEIFSTADGVAP